jgi:DNA recombination protein RmuC
MTAIELILAVLSLALAAACVWLAMRWSADRAATVRAAALAESSVEAVSRVTSERDDARRDLEVRSQQLASTMKELATRQAELVAERQARAEDENEHAELLRLERDHAKQQREEMEKRLTQAHTTLKENFKSLAGDALRESSAQLLNLADERFKAQSQAASADMEKRRVAVDQLVAPIAETLKKTDEKLAAMEKDRIAAHADLRREAQSIQQVGLELRAETGKLSKALSKPEVRGRYGEIQLRRVAELAGMKDHCDFAEQTSNIDRDGNMLRPDMEVRLPNGRTIAVDAKTNTMAYMEAVEATDEPSRQAALDRFARHVEQQIKALSDKKYWQNTSGDLDFVVMFVPGDQFIDAALARKPDLIDLAATRNVLLASPSTLIGLLRAVAVGWREEGLSKKASELIDLCKELHDRAATVYGHMSKVGKGLETAGKAYNDMVGSVETRFTTTLRRLEEAGVKSSKELEVIAPVTTTLRQLTIAPEHS